MQLKFWAAGDGNGGFDIGEGNFTIAHVRNLKFEDGLRVWREYTALIGAEFDPRATAMLFKAAPVMLEALQRVAAAVANGEHCDNIADSGALAAVHAAIEEAKQ